MSINWLPILIGILAAAFGYLVGYVFNRRVIASLMRRGMNITEESANRSLEYIRTAFASVDELLADGRSFLVGDLFSAADFTFAALAAPVLLPKTYGSKLPKLDDVPAELLGTIDEFRASPAGSFALRI